MVFERYRIPKDILHKRSELLVLSDWSSVISCFFCYLIGVNFTWPLLVPLDNFEPVDIATRKWKLVNECIQLTGCYWCLQIFAPSTPFHTVRIPHRCWSVLHIHSLIDKLAYDLLTMWLWSSLTKMWCLIEDQQYRHSFGIVFMTRVEEVDVQHEFASVR